MRTRGDLADRSGGSGISIRRIGGMCEWGRAAELRVRVALMDEFDDVLSGCAGEEDFGDAGFFQGSDVGSGNDAADEDGDVVHSFFVEEFHQLRAERVVGTG